MHLMVKLEVYNYIWRYMYTAREQKFLFNFNVVDIMGSAKYEIWPIQILTVQFQQNAIPQTWTCWFLVIV